MKALAIKALDVHEKLTTGLAKIVWAVSEHVFKLVTWGLACGALVAFAHTTRTEDPKILWTIYALLFLWAATFFAACFKGAVAAQRMVFETEQIPKWLSILMIIAITGGAILAVTIVGPAVLTLFMTFLKSRLV